MSRAVQLLGATLGLGALAAPASAGIWTPIESNTTDDITAIEYQSADRFWFATAAGKIYKRVGGNFELKHNALGVVLKDIEFQAGGPVGFAVGTNGAVLRSQDNGDTWAQVAGIVGGDQTSEFAALPPAGSFRTRSV